MLHGERYFSGCRKPILEYIEEEVRYLDYDGAVALYKYAAEEFTQDEIRVLGLNDRFFLLTVILGRKDASHPWVYDRCREVETEPDGFLDLWARYHYKSTIITFAGGIQDVLQDPELTTCIFAATDKIARPFLEQIKQEFEKNEYLKALYYDVLWANPKVEAPFWSVSDGIVVRRQGNPRERSFEAYGLVEGMPTGKHFRKLLYDDLIKETLVRNPDVIKKVTEQFELSDYLGVGFATRKQMVGTRYSFADSYGILIERGVVETRIYPATEDGTLNGNPVFLTAEAWEKVKRSQTTTISAQMLQNPLAGTNQMFSKDWFRPYFLRPRTLNVYIMCDPSKGKSATSDRTAIAVIGVDANLNKYLLDGYRHRMAMSERYSHLIALWKKWSQAPGVQVCKVGYETYGMQTDDEYIRERMIRDYGAALFELVELNWARDSATQSKEDRVERLEPDFRLANFFLPSVVHHETHGTSLWKVNTGATGAAANQHAIIYRKKEGALRLEKIAVQRDQRYLIPKPIKRADENGDVYDLTRALFEEMLFFPVAPKNDLVDCVSRIYDMEPVAPLLISEEDLLPEEHEDA